MLVIMPHEPIVGTDKIQTRHREYSGRYEMIRAMVAKGREPMMGQIALIMLDQLEETARLANAIEDVSRTCLELALHGKPE